MSGEADSYAPLFDWTAAFHRANWAVPSKEFLFSRGFRNKTVADKISEYLQYAHNLLMPLKQTVDLLMSPLPWLYQTGLRLSTGALDVFYSILECVKWFSKSGQVGRWAQDGGMALYWIDG